MKANHDDANRAIDILTSAGYVAYLAGGCVRDFLLNGTPNDFDLATSAIPDQVLRAFEEAGIPTIPVGISFGVIKAIFGDARELDIATFRTDGKYSDNRRPDVVEYTNSAEEDAKRRDFTINGLFMARDGQILDYVGGQQDLKTRTLRAIGKAEDRIAEDSLRMLRAIRFATRFKMKMDHELVWAIFKLKNTIEKVSKERVTEELTKLFSYGDCHLGYYELRSLGLWNSLFDSSPNEEDTYLAMNGLKKLVPGELFVLALSIILAGCNEAVIQKTLEKLVLTNDQKKSFMSLKDNGHKLAKFLSLDLQEQRKLLQLEDIALIERFVECSQGQYPFNYWLGYQQTIEDYYTRKAEIRAMGWPAPIITGKDLLEMGYIAGPVFSEILEEIRTGQLIGALTSIDQVGPYIIKKFPAAPRMVCGKLIDDMAQQTLICGCKCSRSMSFKVGRLSNGNRDWHNVTEKINVRGDCGQYSTYVYCRACGRKKSKNSFKLIQL